MLTPSLMTESGRLSVIAAATLPTSLVDVTPRGTDWGLAALVAALAGTGVLTIFAGSAGWGWIFVAHGAGGFALAGVLAWKLRRVAPRLAHPLAWDRRTRLGVLSLVLVLGALGSGWAWSSGVGTELYLAGYNALNWHYILGAAVAVVVLGHAAVRAKRPRRSDLADRRQFLRLAAVSGGAYAAWWVQRPLAGALGLEGGRRRFTGSYEASSLTGNDFPETSWVSDDPRPLAGRRWRMTVSGAVEHTLSLRASELDAGDELEAVLDCTGGFWTRQRWRGVRLENLLERAGPDPRATHVRVISHTGYRWSFTLDDARGLLLATHVGDEALSHGHGAPVRLVAPGRRGFEWVKWVERIECHEGPDAGALPSTVWSSFTRAGRGEA